MNLVYAPHPFFKAHVDVIGRDRAPVLVIDNFCSEPGRLVEAAELAFARETRRLAGFPGLVAAADQTFARSTVAHLMPILCKTFGVSGRVQNGGFDFQLMTSLPEDLSPAQMRPHYDVPDTDVIASVLFLCRPPFLGTAFYRHNASGFEVISPERVATYEAALALESIGALEGTGPLEGIGALEGNGAKTGYMTGDTAEFTQIANYGASFNRMILFSAANLHSGCAVRDHGFSCDPKVGRLTANLFLKFAK